MANEKESEGFIAGMPASLYAAACSGSLLRDSGAPVVYLHGRVFAGLVVEFDPTLPPSTMAFRDRNGRELARIIVDDPDPVPAE